MDVTDAVLVEVRERKGLEMVEGLLLEVASYVHFNAVSEIRASEVHCNLYEKQRGVEYGEGADGVKRTLAYVVVYRVFLEFRKYDVYERRRNR